MALCGYIVVIYVKDKPSPNRCLLVIHETVQGKFISELSSVFLVNTYGGWFDWIVSLQAYKLLLLLCFLPLVCSLLYQTRMLCRATSGNRSLILYIGCIPANKPSIASCFLCAFPMLYSPHLEYSVEQVLEADPSASIAGAGRLLIAISMNNPKSPTNAMIIARL